MAKESKTQETTIVKATPKKVDGQKDEQPRGTVKAASISQVRTLGANKQVKHQAAQQERPAHRPPIGTPVVNKELENRVKPPIGKPMGKPVVPKEVAENRNSTGNAGSGETKGSRRRSACCAGTGAEGSRSGSRTESRGSGADRKGRSETASCGREERHCAKGGVRAA